MVKFQLLYNEITAAHLQKIICAQRESCKELSSGLPRDSETIHRARHPGPRWGIRVLTETIVTVEDCDGTVPYRGGQA